MRECHTTDELPTDVCDKYVVTFYRPQTLEKSITKSKTDAPLNNEISLFKKDSKTSNEHNLATLKGKKMMLIVK